MKDKLKNTLLELILALNKSQRLYLSRKWSYPPYSEYLYAKIYFLAIREKKLEHDTIFTALPEVKPSQLGNILKELYTKILDILKLAQRPTPFDEYRSMLKNYTILKGLNLREQASKWQKKAIEYKEANAILSDAVLVDEESYYFEMLADTADQYMFGNEVHPFSASLKKEYLHLRRFYLTKRFSKNAEEYKRLENQTTQVIDKIDYRQLSLYDKIVYTRLLYQYYYIQRNFVLAYKYASTLIRIYENEGLDTYYEEVYLKFLNYKLLCLFRLNARIKYRRVLDGFQNIAFKPSLQNVRLLQATHFKYQATHELNWHIINGDFAGGIAFLNETIIPVLEKSNRFDASFINGTHYKAACIFFGNQEFGKCIYHLDKIIYFKETTLRSDLEIFARILKLTALFELREDEYIFENIRSVYGYLARNKQLNAFQREIMNFLRICARLPEANIRDELQNLREALYKVAQDKFEQRPFFYFDVISWLDSRLTNKTISEVISERGLGHRVLYGE